LNWFLSSSQQWLSSSTLLVALLIAHKGAQSPGSGRMEVICALVFLFHMRTSGRVAMAPPSLDPNQTLTSPNRTLTRHSPTGRVGPWDTHYQFSKTTLLSKTLTVLSSWRRGDLENRFPRSTQEIFLLFTWNWWLGPLPFLSWAGLTSLLVSTTVAPDGTGAIWCFSHNWAWDWAAWNRFFPPDFGLSRINPNSFLIVRIEPFQSDVLVTIRIDLAEFDVFFEDRI